MQVRDISLLHHSGLTIQVRLILRISRLARNITTKVPLTHFLPSSKQKVYEACSGG